MTEIRDRAKDQVAQSGVRPPRLLIVDDEADIRLMLSLFLKHEGYDVVTLPSASSALEVARRERFDAVVSDIGMPEMDGYKLAGALRQLRGYASVPLIAITGFVEFSDRQRALQAGFDERLTKPINLESLLKLIKRLLDGK